MTLEEPVEADEAKAVPLDACTERRPLGAGDLGRIGEESRGPELNAIRARAGKRRKQPVEGRIIAPREKDGEFYGGHGLSHGPQVPIPAARPPVNPECVWRGPCGLAFAVDRGSLLGMGTAVGDAGRASSRQLQDKQSEADHRQIPINRVGVKGLRHPVRVRDKQHETQDTIARIDMSVDLPHHFKGTHMSRFIEALNAHGREIHVRNIPEILEELRGRLDAECAHLTMEFPYFLEKRAPVSGAPSLMDYSIRFEATFEGGKMDFVCTVVVPVTTLCPCSKAISERGAHNQRGYVTLSVRFGARPVWIEDLVQMVEDSASCDVFSLLKRPDEKFVTERAFDNPVFVEDLVRNVALRLNRHPDIAWYRVEAENLESIHNHSAFAVVERG